MHILERSPRWKCFKVGRGLLLTAAMLVIGAVDGCVEKKPMPDKIDSSEPDQKKEPVEPDKELVASISCLASKVAQPDKVRWDVALTLAEISNATYSEDEEQESLLKSLGAIQVRPLAKGSSHGVVASNNDVVVIAFRGTKEPADWLTDVKIAGRRIANGTMHRGFHDAVDVIFNDVYAEAIRQGAKEKAVWVTGHSLGGAMAVVFSYRAVNDKELAPAGVVTFGQPLALSTTLAQFMLNKFTFRYTRFVNSWDPVTRLLPTYRHAGSRIHLTPDDFTIRQPMIAVSAPAKASVENSSNVLFVEDDEKLEAMTEEEFKEFQKELRDEHSPPKIQDGQLTVGAGLPLLSSHSILTYIERIKTIGQQNSK